MMRVRHIYAALEPKYESFLIPFRWAAVCNAYTTLTHHPGEHTLTNAAAHYNRVPLSFCT